MSSFSYAQYQAVAAQEQANGENSTRVGYFKLKDDGDIAIARLNISSTEDLDFASVHTIGMNGRWLKVSCLNPLGSFGSTCPLCSAHSANTKGSISKAVKKVFIQMIVSYRDPASATGYTSPIPVIWDRPAAFSREIANKLMIAGNLRNTLVLITRNGKAGDMQTTYSMDILPADHPVFKPEMIPADFSAFDNFNIARHSFWEKTIDEINTYLATGQFPERTTQSGVSTNSMNSFAPTASTMPTINGTVPNALVNNNYATPVVQGTYMPNNAPNNVSNMQNVPDFNAGASSTSFNPGPTVLNTDAVSGTVANQPPVRNFTSFSF